MAQSSFVERNKEDDPFLQTIAKEIIQKERPKFQQMDNDSIKLKN